MNLVMFLSDRCNMSCSYCFLFLNKGAATVLPEKAARAAVEAHISGGSRGERRLTILGGEPLIHFPLVREVLETIRRAGPEVAASVVTNGTLLCPKKCAEVLELGAELTVSLDGNPADHDRHRRLLNGGPSLAEALKALEGCDRERLRANMVVSPDCAGNLLANVEFLRGAGLGRISFHPDVVGDWRDASLEAFAISLRAFARYHRTLASTGAAPEVTNLTNYSEPFRGPAGSCPAYDDLVLGADGNYYPCDGLFALPYRDLGSWRVGSALGGVDWAGRAAHQDRAREAIHRVLGSSHATCPRETYFHEIARGAVPARAVRAFHRADAALGVCLRSLLVSEVHGTR